MALIPNLPASLMDMHHHWHVPSAHAGAPGGRVHPFGTTGAGLEFLQFHRDFVAQFHTWYDARPFGTAPFNTAPFLTAASAQAAVAGWTSIPAALKNGAVTGWGGVQIGQEARLTTLTPPFATVDELGTYIEGGIHGWIHGAAASAFGEPIVGGFHSPQSTYFYGIHGLVDYWWTRWVNSRKRPLKDVIDNKRRIKDIKENKEFIKERKELLFEKIQPEKPVKEKDKDKDIFEGGRFPERGGEPFSLPSAGGFGDPEGSPESAGTAMTDSDALMMDIHERLTDLETRFSQQAFITPEERPAVGEAAHPEENQLPVDKPPKKDRT